MEVYGIDISNPSREGKIPIARGAVSVVLVKYYGFNPKEAGALSGLDRTTVIYHNAEHEGRYRYSSFYASLYDTICSFAINDGAIDPDSDMMEIVNLMKISFDDV